jgi:hypothetical protein
MERCSYPSPAGATVRTCTGRDRRGCVATSAPETALNRRSSITVGLQVPAVAPRYQREPGRGSLRPAMCEREPGRGSLRPAMCEREPGRGSLRPPAPVHCSARSSLRAHFRGDPPRRAGPPPTARQAQTPGGEKRIRHQVRCAAATWRNDAPSKAVWPEGDGRSHVGRAAARRGGSPRK